MTLGRPRLHLRVCGSTNDEGRALAAAGAPHGTLVTADEQTAGRGRQGRSWVAPAGTALLCSIVVREVEPLLPLRAGLAVADVAGGQVKWPNDVWLAGRKVAGILVEGRPAEGWAVIGIGVNVGSVAFPPDLAEIATTLDRPGDVEAVLDELLESLGRWLPAPAADVVEALTGRDALRGRPVRWQGGEGVGDGIDAGGGLRVRTPDGVVVLDAGEVHLLR